MSVLVAVGEITNHGWDMGYLIIGGFMGMLGATLMFIYAEVRKENEEDEDE